MRSQDKSAFPKPRWRQLGGTVRVCPPVSRHLVRAAHELIHNHFVSDATWAALAERCSTLQLMELVFIVGNYSMLVMATNSFGVQPERNVAESWKPY
jgi:hypothetical protein